VHRSAGRWPRERQEAATIRRRDGHEIIRNCTRRYGRLLIGILFGVTTRRIGVTVSLLVAFSGMVDVYSNMARASSMMPEVELPLGYSRLLSGTLGDSRVLSGNLG